MKSDPNVRWEISGVVDSVDAQNGKITLWLRSFESLQTVCISPVMPGWLLHPEVGFRTRIPRRCVRERNLVNVVWGEFYPEDYSGLSDDDLLFWRWI